MQAEDIFITASKKDFKILQDALEVAINYHSGQFRKSGEPYIVHPIGVSQVLWKQYKNVPLSVAGLLHDVLEDCPNASALEIKQSFGKEVLFLVEAVSKNMDGFTDYKNIFQDKTQRFLWAGIKNIKVFLLKLADRENNISTLDALAPNKQVRMSFETQAIFYPLKKICESESIQSANKKFFLFCENNNIIDECMLQDYLYSQTYENFDGLLFQQIYNNTDKIIWKLSDKSYYMNLCSQPHFEQNHEILSLTEDVSGVFELTFQVKKGGFFFDEKKYIDISSYHY